ncbi:MAG TPA: type II secretion system ATPase GspE [Nitrospiria bacterium]|jgi:general secretion pathway protein E
MRRKPIGEILREKFFLTPEQLEEGLKIQKEKGGRIGEILVRLKFVKMDQVLESLAVQMSIPFLPEIHISDIDPALAVRIPLGFAKKNGLLPLKSEGGKVWVATSNPLNVTTLDDIRLLLQSPIQVAVAPGKTILDRINEVYDRPSDTAEQVVEDLSGERLDLVASSLEEPVDLLEATDEAPIIRLVNSLLFQGVKDRASDIHVEPFERDLLIRFRIDGVLYNILSPPKHAQASIVSRIKIMAGMNIAEKRLPQDGRIGVRIAGKEVDIRVSAIPTAHGERVVMRLLDKSNLLLNLGEIGLSSSDLGLLEQIIQLTHGILLVTGPTGSGKTTTLYAALSKINSPDKNIITVEDPIEYQLKGIGQMQVNSKIQLTFASGLRSILRQDPDVIMVGEIRDSETAEIAIHASLTGHLVFSTLHTNDSSGAITRLIDMGIEPFLVSSSVVAIIAQRLVRIICFHCRQPYLPSEEEKQKLGILTGDSKKNIYRAVGCEKCMNTGYHGRIGIYEIMRLDDEIRNLVLSCTDSSTIKQRAIQKGMRTLREDGARKVLEGLTTTEEVLRVTQQEIR